MDADVSAVSPARRTEVACRGRSARSVDLVEFAGGHVEDEAPDTLLVHDEGVRLDPRDRLADVRGGIPESLRGPWRTDGCCAPSATVGFARELVRKPTRRDCSAAVGGVGVQEVGELPGSVGAQSAPRVMGGDGGRGLAGVVSEAVGGGTGRTLSIR
jgi:hypothetical protein